MTFNKIIPFEKNHYNPKLIQEITEIGVKTSSAVVNRFESIDFMIITWNLLIVTHNS